MSVWIVAFTLRGANLAAYLGRTLPGARAFSMAKYAAQAGTEPVERLADWCRRAWEEAEGLVFVGAAGIAVRSIAPRLQSKTTDPAVVVVDEGGQFAISLASGHMGGANELTRQVAACLGATPVVTTATDVNGKFAVDVFAVKNGLAITSMRRAKEISAAILAGKPVGLHTELPLEGVRESTQNIVWFLRAPRVLLGALVGAALTLSGVGMQAFTKNPLAEPYVLGISSGASLGAVLAMLLGVSLPVLGRLSVSAGAFAGALVSILLVYLLARTRNAVTPIRLILVGVAVSAMFQAFTNYIVYTAPDDAAVREATFWMLGGLGSAKWEDLPLLALILPPLFLVLMALARPLNAMLMGDSSAVTLGVDLDRVRGVLILSSALLTASAVAVSGCIGFVGLVIPHLVRSVVGADHRRLIPLSALCGAVFMIWMDVGARLAVRPEEIPVGIITAFIGAPLFLWMIRVRRYEF